MPVFGIFAVSQNDLDDVANIDIATFIESIKTEDQKRKEMMRGKKKNDKQLWHLVQLFCLFAGMDPLDSSIKSCQISAVLQQTKW